MDKDTLVAANGHSLLFNTGVAHIAEQNFSGQREKSFELPGEPEGESGELELEDTKEGEASLARLIPTHIHTVEQFLIFRNIT